MTPPINTLLQKWNGEQMISINTHDTFSKNTYKSIPENMKCRARTWTGRCAHKKCQSGNYPHLCLMCSKKAEVTPIPNSFESNSLVLGKSPKRIGLKFGTIDTPITELIFSPNGQIATVWPNPEVHKIVSQAKSKGITFHPGSKEGRLKIKPSSKPIKIKIPKKTHTNHPNVFIPTNLDSIKSPKKIKLKIKKSPNTSKDSTNTRKIKFIKPATFLPDGTVDFGYLSGSDDEDDEKDTEIENSEDPVKYLQNEIQEAGGISKIKVTQLKSWLSIIGLSTSGNKKTLQHRITTWIEEDQSDTDSEDED